MRKDDRTAFAVGRLFSVFLFCAFFVLSESDVQLPVAFIGKVIERRREGAEFAVFAGGVARHLQKDTVEGHFA